ncbi:MAG: hypothetical protein LUD69_02080 [Oscillospiraceae bacterium]|nr:hypothetical protein [Oscillospiraceae bacterium]
MDKARRHNKAHPFSPARGGDMGSIIPEIRRENKWKGLPPAEISFAPGERQLEHFFFWLKIFSNPVRFPLILRGRYGIIYLYRRKHK